MNVGRVDWSPDYHRPPRPDPCLVSLLPLAAEPSERAWKAARKCPHGCGRVCLRDTSLSATESRTP